MTATQNHAPPVRLTTSWDDYRYVRAVADTRSLVGAAEALGVNHSTVFRRINAIEETLGTRLFERGRAGYALTAAGEEMVALAGRMSEDITSFERRIAGRDVKPSGELRITTNDTMMAHLMAPIIASFLSTFPDVRLDVVVSNASLNLSKRDADVAIRATVSPPETLVGRRVCALGWAVYGPARHAGRSLADMRDERWIGFGENLAHVAPARWMKESVAADKIVIRLNTILGFAEAIASTGYLGVVPCFIGDQMQSLTRLAEPEPDLAAGLWLLTHPDLKQSARVRAFMDHAWEALSRRRSLLEGRGATPGGAMPEGRG